MKIILNSLIILLTFYSCSNEEEYRELNITYKSTESLESVENFTKVIIFPNPFYNTVNLVVNGEGEILISNQKGGIKKIPVNSQNLAIDFSKEKSGTYYCEIYLNGTVFRRHLIKM